ncbi:transglycosylase domain-containing protein [Actinoplanes sp. NPDC049548]|uniref:transglycosylase domain-containing protein n=1 Tax=Actinoplanes sp. NPDC049548 TaxID=3155152 RepID=UPI0034411065
MPNQPLNADDVPHGPGRRRRPSRWRRTLIRLLVVLLLVCGAAAAGIEIYIRSVPLPAESAKPQASTLYYRDGHTILARVGTTDHSDVPLSAVPEAVRWAVLAAEDRDFYHHGGISIRGVLRAVVANVRGSREGASTVTQQYARNAYLSQDVTVERKAKEFALAVQLERKFTKDEILERYLNTIYFGRGAYGIAAAAYAYFGTTPSQLTAAQGTVLAAVIKDPYNFDPANDRAAARTRWDWIVQAQREQGWLEQTLAYPAVNPAHAKDPGPNGPIIDRVEAELAALGITPRALHTRGLSVTTTLDARAQQAAVTQVKKRLSGQPKGLLAALVAVDPGTGGVRAYYGGNQGRGYFDNASAPRPAASTFKPIVLAAALRNGIAYESRWDGSSPRVFPGRLGVPLRNQKNLQCPFCTLEESMVDSLNTPFYSVTERIGADTVRRMANTLGVPRQYANAPSLVDVKGDPAPGKTRPDIALGRYPVAPADIASVYATFAANGVRRDRHFVDGVSTASGEPLRMPKRRTVRAIDRDVAADVSTVLSSVVRAHDLSPDHPAAGKTGSQQWGDTADNQDAWMAGYTPELATAVWIGKAQPGPIRDAKGRRIEGETMPAKLWKAFTSDALQGTAPTALPRPAHVGSPLAGDAQPPVVEEVERKKQPPKETEERSESLPAKRGLPSAGPSPSEGEGDAAAAAKEQADSEEPAN